MLYYAIRCYTVIPYHTIPYHTPPYHTIPYHIIVMVIVQVIVIVIVIPVSAVCEINTHPTCRQCRTTPPLLPNVNFELWGRGGEDNIMILPSRTGVYFANTCIATRVRCMARPALGMGRGYEHHWNHSPARRRGSATGGSNHEITQRSLCC